MRAVGVIAEFNPFHRGHAYALRQARALAHADIVVVVMSGNYVQRGEPAIVDKWVRAKAALSHGADLVIELPLSGAVQAADGFAAYALALLADLGVASLAFGAEDPTLPYAQIAAKVLALPPDPHAFGDYRATYATQLNQLYQEVTGVEITSPNVMLGLSYAKANAQLAAPLDLLPFSRLGVDHDAKEVAEGFASASFIRQQLLAKRPVTTFLAPDTLQAIQACRHLSWADFFPWLKYRLLTANTTQLVQIFSMREGLDRRMQTQIAASPDFDTFLKQVKSKRYTYARLRRLALYTVLNLTKDQVQREIRHPYHHVLGFTPAGQHFLNRQKHRVNYPLVTKVDRPMLAPGGLIAVTGQADGLIQFLTGEQQNFGRPPLM